ncbi:menaquinone biosynthetic enzyme MqnA/MqnD family protein [Anatilimnocola sp. NA78]|uniref:menaquinone biosynthetic enzyme MqnA/MqnD family protein n=1 Tax=Anatilimnocola sp. NA78 TaxID=3415683 RepID=UPI003CE56633
MKVGAVSYLNTKPLVYGLPTRERDFELVFDLPSRLADRLGRGELDVALIPSIEFFQNPSYTIISDACIGCRGPVFSVKLFSRVPVSQIKTLALDEGSRTSAALVQILLKERHGVTPALLPLPIGSPWEESPADGILVIGDRAMHPPRQGSHLAPRDESISRSEVTALGEYAEIWDLGDVWCRWAELPFVFAMWVARPGIDTTDLAARLSLARDQGLAHLPQIAAAEAPRYGLSYEQCLVYLRDNLHFYLHDRELSGLRKFHEYAIRLGLAPAEVGVPALAGVTRIDKGTA